MALGLSFWASGDDVGAFGEIDRALAVNPNHAWALGMRGFFLGSSGRPQEGLSALEKAMRASPHDPLMWAWLLWAAGTHYLAREWEEAVATADRLIRFRPDKHFAHRWRAAALAQLGRLDEAKQSLRAAIDASPEQFRIYVSQRPPWARPADHALMVEGLRKAGWTEE